MKTTTLKRKIHNYWLVPLLAVSLMSCFSDGPKQPELTSLDKQALQTRMFKSTKVILFASVVSVLQDLGYNINTADKDSGFINAISPQTVTSSAGQKIFFGTTEQENTKVTAFIEELPQGTRVRLTFLRTTKRTSGASAFEGDTYDGETTTDQPIYDRNLYTNAFNLVEEAIFIRTPTKSTQ
ncbi:MAG: hypothetical protein K0U66_06950 [Gammaproteobacteria bacterium]|nr:hypothetical protein [Pseudomonadota bacterium]MCH9663378.1 hypothetical protein [Gammaproteobacteria bacterium]